MHYVAKDKEGRAVAILEAADKVDALLFSLCNEYGGHVEEVASPLPVIQVPRQEPKEHYFRGIRK